MAHAETTANATAYNGGIPPPTLAPSSISTCERSQRKRRVIQKKGIDDEHIMARGRENASTKRVGRAPERGWVQIFTFPSAVPSGGGPSTYFTETLLTQWRSFVGVIRSPSNT